MQEKGRKGKEKEGRLFPLTNLLSFGSLLAPSPFKSLKGGVTCNIGVFV
jgi:hypothetical protein